MKELMYHSNANLTGYNDIGGKSLAYEYNLQPERQDKGVFAAKTKVSWPKVHEVVNMWASKSSTMTWYIKSEV